MDNIIEFKQKPKSEPQSEHMFELHVYCLPTGELEVDMEIDGWADDKEVFEALVSVGMKFAEDNNLVEPHTTLTTQPSRLTEEEFDEMILELEIDKESE